MSALTVYVEGVGLRAPGLPDWTAAVTTLRDGAPCTAHPLATPQPARLPPAERRRAPELVLLACTVAAEACAHAAREPASLPCVFASTYGDQATTALICATLAAHPRELSPTRFHNSVLNAAVGYWTIGSGCRAPATALSAWHASFAAGLLEAACEAVGDDTAVLYAACDGAGSGPLGAVTRSTAAFGTALVLAPTPDAHTLARLDLECVAGAAPKAPPIPALAALAAGSPLAVSLPLFAALAHRAAASVTLAAGPQSHLRIEVSV